MCKISSVTKINDENRDAVWVFMMKLGEIISRFNNDGLGYAAFDEKGNIFGERWLFNAMAFKDFSKDSNITPEQISKVYNYFGNKVVRDEAQAIILHTRMATCEKGLRNTHPFVNNIDSPEIAIIHNGIISNHHSLVKKYSSCDSEVIVHLYEKENLKEKLDNIANVTKQMYGWYTTLALLKTNDGRMVMDAVSDSQRLSSYYIPELGVRVYSTDARDIIEAAKHFNFNTTQFSIIRANSAFRIDVLTGEVIETARAPEREHKQISGWPQGNVHHASGNADSDFITQFLLKGNR